MTKIPESPSCSALSSKSPSQDSLALSLEEPLENSFTLAPEEPLEDSFALSPEAPLGDSFTHPSGKSCRFPIPQKSNPLLTTLCYIQQKDCYLMLHRVKKQNDISQGKWLGVGGKFLPDETADECILREAKEETGFDLTQWEYRGVVHFYNTEYQPEEMYLYTATDFLVPSLDGTPSTTTAVLSETADSLDASKADFLNASKSDSSSSNKLPLPECNEGTFAWIPLAEVLALPLWDGDRIFLSQLAQGVRDIEITVRYEGDMLVEAIDHRANQSIDIATVCRTPSDPK